MGPFEHPRQPALVESRIEWIGPAGGCGQRRRTRPSRTRRWKPSSRKIVIGISSGSASVGTVGATCRRSGETGISTPASRPSAPAQAPAALTTCRAAIGPAVVCTCVTRPGRRLATAKPVTSTPKSNRTPSRRAAST